MLATLFAPLPVPMAFAIFFIMWWIVLFAVLPFGVTTQDEATSRALGTDPGAPVSPHLALKALATTIVAALLFSALLVYLKLSDS